MPSAQVCNPMQFVMNESSEHTLCLHRVEQSCRTGVVSDAIKCSPTDKRHPESQSAVKAPGEEVIH